MPLSARIKPLDPAWSLPRWIWLSPKFALSWLRRNARARSASPHPQSRSPQSTTTSPPDLYFYFLPFCTYFAWFFLFFSVNCFFPSLDVTFVLFSKVFIFI